MGALIPKLGVKKAPGKRLIRLFVKFETRMEESRVLVMVGK